MEKSNEREKRIKRSPRRKKENQNEVKSNIKTKTETKIKTKTKKTVKSSSKGNKRQSIDEQIKSFYEDENILKVIKPKYNFILKFYEEVNKNGTILLIFLLLILSTGENKALSGLVVLLMFITFIFKAVINYKVFNSTVYLLYKDKIVRKNLYFNKEKVLNYEDLKDIRYGAINNSFIKTIMNVRDMYFIHKKTILFNFRNIKIPNQPDDLNYREEIIRTVDPKYLEEIVQQNTKKSKQNKIKENEKSKTKSKIKKVKKIK